MNSTLFEKDGILIETVPSATDCSRDVTRVVWQDETILGYITMRINESVAEDIGEILLEMYNHGQFNAYWGMKNYTKTMLRRLDND